MQGKVSWTAELAADPFHQWLDRGVQFDFGYLKHHSPDWRHFYTSNVSFKRSLLGRELFRTKFVGWGFEDSEFGYRLMKKGMELSYDPECEVLHDDPQTLEGVLRRTKEARENAKRFETMHPEVRILPRGMKRLLLEVALVLALVVMPLRIQVYWWWEWKKAWLGKESKGNIPS